MKNLTTNSVNDMDSIIQSYIVQGYAIAHKTTNSVTLVKPKSFNWLIAALGLCFLVFGLFVYLAYYMMKRDDVITINVQSAAAAVAA